MKYLKFSIGSALALGVTFGTATLLIWLIPVRGIGLTAIVAPITCILLITLLSVTMQLTLKEKI